MKDYQVIECRLTVSVTVLFNPRYFSEDYTTVHCVYDGVTGAGMKLSCKQNKLKKPTPNNQKPHPKEPQLFRDWINSKKHV